MGKTIELKRMPAAWQVLAKAGTTFFKKGKGNLPDTTISTKQCSIDPTNLKAYNEICHFKDAKFVPATYPYIYSFPLQMQLMSERDFPYPLPGLVHLANSIKQKRALQHDEKFDIYCHFGDKIYHDKGQAFEIKTGIIIKNEIIWSCTSIYLFRGKSDSGNAIAWEEPLPIENGRKQSWSLASTLGIQYAMINKDINPIHIMPLSAKLFGMKRHIIHGMWCLGRVLAAESERANLDTVTIDVHFKTPVFLPSAIIYRRENDPNRLQKINFDIVDSKEDKPHARGSILIG